MSPVIYALDQFISYNQSYVPGNCPGPESHGECHVQFIRKEPCSFGWDWVSSLDSTIEHEHIPTIFIESKVFELFENDKN